MQNEPLTGMFYGDKLQKILVDPNTTYRNEKVLKTVRVMFFLKLVGWLNKFNAWIQSKNISRVKEVCTLIGGHLQQRHLPVQH